MMTSGYTYDQEVIGNEQGFSLVELLAAVVITAVIVAAALTTVVSSNRANQVNSQVADTQQNVRVAMDVISKDIRMAGFNYNATDPATPIIGGCSAGGRPAGLLPQDQNPGGADTGPDRVSLVVPLLTDTAAPWVLSAAAGSVPPNPVTPFTVITLTGAAITDMAAQGLAAGSVVSIGGAVSRRVLSLTAGTITLDMAVDGQVPIGTPVYLMQCVQYQIATSVATCGADSAPCLVRNGIPMVGGVEDLQLAYACDGCNTAPPNPLAPDGVIDEWETPANGFTNGDFVSNNTWSGTAPLTTMTPNTIRLAQISIVARQTRNDEGTSERGTPGQNSSGPILVGDHDPSNPGDPGYNFASYQQQRRRVLTRSVQPRNL
jgi:type IV pilus assembly protein PilW